MLIPRDLTDPPLRIESALGTAWDSPALNRAVEQMGLRLDEVVVVSGLGGRLDDTVGVAIYQLPVGREERLESLFLEESQADGAAWERREVAGRTVSWVAGDDFVEASWTRPGLVISVAGVDAGVVEAAIDRLP